MKYVIIARVYVSLLCLIYCNAYAASLKSTDGTSIDYTNDPYVALINITQGSGGFCLGTFIKPNTIITAAHCVYQKGTLVDPTNVRVFPQPKNFSLDSPYLGVRKIIANPGFNAFKPNIFTSIINDSAILILKYRQIIKPLEYDYSFNPDNYLTAQYGQSALFRYFGSDLITHDIKVGEMRVMTSKKCSDELQDILEHEPNLTDKQKAILPAMRKELLNNPGTLFCAINLKTDKITGTAGDSGGVLYFTVNNTTKKLAGIEYGSLTTFSNSNKYRSIILFSNVFNYKDFLNSCINKTAAKDNDNLCNISATTSATAIKYLLLN